MPPSKTDTPALKWAINDCALTYALINVLIDYPNLRKNIWPAPGEKVSGKTKTTHYQGIAERLLAEYEPYDTFVKTKEGRKAYGTAVGAQLKQMTKKWKGARRELGVTGAGLNHETDIWQGERGDKLRNIWIRVKQSCPYFYDLKPLLGKQMLDTDHAVNHSSNDIGDVDSLMTRRIFVAPPTRTGSAPLDEEEGRNDLLGDTQDSEINVDNDDTNLDFNLDDPDTVQAPAQPAHRSSQNPTSVEPEVLAKRRTKNDQFSDFGNMVKSSVDQVVTRKRQRDEDDRDTEQLKVKLKIDLEEKRLKMEHEAKMRRMELELGQDVEMRRIALEERKMKLQEQEFALRHPQRLIEGSSADNLLLD